MLDKVIFAFGCTVIAAGGFAVYLAMHELIMLDRNAGIRAKEDCIARGGKVIEARTLFSTFMCDGPTQFDQKVAP